MAPPITAQATAGILLAIVCHLLSVLILHRLVLCITTPSPNKRLAFAAAALHIVSPAGIFLLAPYGESLTSLLNFTGMLCYAKGALRSRDTGHPTLIQSLWTLSAGLSFGIATTIRSNALLSGAIFAYDILSSLRSLPSLLTSLAGVQHLASLGLASLLTLSGLVIPQYIAYSAYCSPSAATADTTPRPWCVNTAPSIYTFVQRHYWNVGFLRYWTASNVPLFLLAAPMLYLLFSTGIRALAMRTERTSRSPPPSSTSRDSRNNSAVQTGEALFAVQMLRRLAVPQLLLALLALTSFHVQIVIRIASAYPVWYILLASDMLGDDAVGEQAGKERGAIKGRTDNEVRGRGGGRTGERKEWTPVLVKGLMIYGLVQAGLFASFLPPA
ncbi:hypothetical protein LTS18_003794 [Coniosporium uncinatum]|uniref:Uncharacterized protein n=1 Tax=Coniosporium uncinatum TaxID=93489 RepID=A0ACC3DTG2_9PEZI|nr:hypothetical protein LTS18_003794 [Coniosporium uncinatum]